MRALVVGGASCGKSAFAEELCMALGGKRVYLAAMRPFGEEGARRVRKHRAQRAGKGFETVECYEHFDSTCDDARLAGATVLLESLGNVVANAMFSEGAPQTGVDCTALATSIGRIAENCGNLVIVGDEVGCDGVSYALETRAYQEALGALTRELGSSCDLVVECVSGVPSVLKWTRACDCAREVEKMLGLPS